MTYGCGIWPYANGVRREKGPTKFLKGTSGPLSNGPLTADTIWLLSGRFNFSVRHLNGDICLSSVTSDHQRYITEDAEPDVETFFFFLCMYMFPVYPLSVGAESPIWPECATVLGGNQWVDDIDQVNGTFANFSQGKVRPFQMVTATRVKHGMQRSIYRFHTQPMQNSCSQSCASSSSSIYNNAICFILSRILNATC